MNKFLLIHLVFLAITSFSGIALFIYGYTFKWVIIDWFILTGFVISAITGWIIAVKKQSKRIAKTYFILASFSPLIFILVSACKSLMLGIVLFIYVIFTFFGASRTLYSQENYRIARQPAGLSDKSYSVYEMYTFLENEYGVYYSQNNPADISDLKILKDSLFITYGKNKMEKIKFQKYFKNKSASSPF